MDLIRGTNLSVQFAARKKHIFERKTVINALDNVNVTIKKGQSIAIVGESGSGKTTLMKTLFGLQKTATGEVYYAGKKVSAKGRQRWLRAKSGIIFQDPYSSLDPRMKIGDSVAEPLQALKVPGDHKEMVLGILERLDLPPDSFDRFPAEFSGGQRQRVAIARAIVHSPEVLVGDEPVSALDVLVRRKIIDLLNSLRTELGLTMITITHDLGIVPEIAEQVLVMREGSVIEKGTVEEIFTSPQDPYTASLISALPRIPKELRIAADN